MNQKDLAKRLGANVDAIGLWEKKGLLHPSRGVTGWKKESGLRGGECDYTEEDVQRGALIKGLRDARWEFVDILVVFADPDWRERNADMIREILSPQNPEA